MHRFLLFAFLFLSAGLARPVLAQTDGLPPRPNPFRFVNDQAQLMQPADAKKLENGLRRYADNTGTQVVVVTVPSLGGRTVSDYGRALGNAWGVGQRDKNNGIVVLVSQQERKVTIQPGSGLESVITPAVTSRVINEMTPGFKQGNYFAGLRTGLNTLMATANPNTAKNQAAASNDVATPGATDGMSTTESSASSNLSQNTQYPTSNEPVTTPIESAPSGPGMGTLLIGALVIGGILWFIIRMFRNRSAAGSAPQNGTPNFYPNRPSGPAGGGYGQAPGNYGPAGYGQMPMQSSGSGIGGMLATGAAAAAGAYIGNRMASGHDTSGQNMSNYDNSNFNTGAAGVAGAAGTGAAGDYFSSRDGGTTENTSPDYFSDANTASDNSSDYFSSDDNSSYDDPSSGDTGGGGFDSSNDNSGSW
ncbi:TPM domain-containing protein [Hymenobacter negativus]|uniref:TPM domain-containing protein n=1 Tax=Hymenobacter negativus TaxID=2795026 RepID=A0ABS3QHQ9_9BACT|nr:TPM domain-containing protein [Hymenobacter negativus]MBO2010255.1 TPM domain-containing protein [Hymenobacter negativus]